MSILKITEFCWQVQEERPLEVETDDPPPKKVRENFLGWHVTDLYLGRRGIEMPKSQEGIFGWEIAINRRREEEGRFKSLSSIPFFHQKKGGGRGGPTKNTNQSSFLSTWRRR